MQCDRALGHIHSMRDRGIRPTRDRSCDSKFGFKRNVDQTYPIFQRIFFNKATPTSLYPFILHLHSYIPPKATSLLNSGIPFLFNWIVRSYGHEWCLCVEPIFFHGWSGCPTLLAGTFNEGGWCLSGLKWVETVDPWQTKPSLTFSDSHKCFLLSLFLGCHFTCQTSEIGGRGKYPSLGYEVWVFVWVWQALSLKKGKLNRKWETERNQVDKFPLSSLPQYEIHLCNSSGEFPSAEWASYGLCHPWIHVKQSPSYWRTCSLASFSFSFPSSSLGFYHPSNVLATWVLSSGSVFPGYDNLY